MEYADNPLKPALLQILRTCSTSLSEYQLIQTLNQYKGMFPALSDSQQLALFQRHFLVMNALYQIQRELWPEGLYLEISPLSICLHLRGESSACHHTPADNGEQKLRDYYLDWQHFEATSEQDVVSLLNGFWQRYMAVDLKMDAYQILQVTPEDGWSAVRQSYRRLAAKYHPDRGGDVTQFLVVREAYEVLSQVHAV